MRTIQIYGHSDDLFELEGTVRSLGEPDEIGYFGGEVVVRLLEGAGSDVGCLIYGNYDPYSGCWKFAIGKLGEDSPVPGWAATAVWDYNNPDHPYSPLLVLTVPDNVLVTKVLPEEER